MNLKAIRVLLIGDDPADARAVREALASAEDGSFTVERAARLSEGLERLSRKGIAAVLLDLRLSDSQGIATFDRVRQAAHHVPILIIGSADDQDIARQAVDRGAQDYLQKAHLDRYSLPRILRHVVERQAAEDALFFEQQRADVTLSSIGDAVLTINASGNVTSLNGVSERMTGWPREEALGRPLDEIFQIIDGATREPVPSPLAAAVQIHDIVGLPPNCLLVRRDGFEAAIEDSASPIHDRAGQVIGAVMVFHDVSAARTLSLEAAHRAQHDFLTNLPNRALLKDRLTQAVALARRHGHRLAVLFLDLDRFKHVNDSL